MWTKLVAQNSPEDAVFHIANDGKDRKGITYRKTECIRELYNEGVDVLFIFDDDTFPIEKGWTSFFIDALQASGQNHFCYLKETPGNTKVKSTNVGGVVINEYQNCNGCLMVMTRKAVETVGGFNPNYSIYGFEHADYTNRIHAAGLNPMGRYLCPEGASKYIYSCDLDNTRPEIQKKLKHRSSMSAKEALHHVAKSEVIYRQATQIYFPL